MNRWKELTFGQDISLGLEPHRLRTSIWWTDSSVAISVDLVAFVLGQGRRVRSNDDMVFYNQPQTPDTSVVHEGKVCERDRGIDELSLNLDLVGDDILSLVIAVSSEDARLSEFTELQWCVSLESGQTAFICLADGFTSERAAVLGEVYRQDNSWRLCAVGQGREGGLAAIASGYGVTIATDEPESIHHHSTHRSW